MTGRTYESVKADLIAQGNWGNRPEGMWHNPHVSHPNGSCEYLRIARGDLEDQDYCRYCLAEMPTPFGFLAEEINANAARRKLEEDLRFSDFVESFIKNDFVKLCKKVKKKPHQSGIGPDDLRFLLFLEYYKGTSRKDTHELIIEKLTELGAKPSV